MAHGDASSDAERFIVRMPPGMRDRVRAAAEKHGRSMNAEIVAILQEAFPEPSPIEALTAELAAAATAFDHARDEPSRKRALDAIHDLQALIEAERHEFGEGANEALLTRDEK